MQKRSAAAVIGLTYHVRSALGLTFVLLISCIGTPIRAATSKPPLMAVLPFEIEDNSGEIGSADRHDAMLSAVTAAIRQKMEAAGSYRIVTQKQVTKAVNEAKPGTYLRNCNGCELDIAKRVNAQRVLIGWVFKMSTLIGTLHICIEDVATGNVVYRKDFDFRGDNERAWTRAADYFVQSLNKTP